MDRLDRLVWIDLETTGLEPELDVILEIAVVVTDGKLTELASASLVVARALPEERDNAKPFVQNMHDDNGLWYDCHVGKFTCDEVEVLMADFIDKFAPNYKGPICGSSPHFDMSFLKLQMPRVAEQFNHRCFDVSTIKQCACQFSGRPYVEREESTHRALADIRGSIQVARDLTTASILVGPR